MIYFLIGSDLLMILIFFLKSSGLPEQIPLFYSLTWGEDQLAEQWMIFLLPIILNIFFFVNQFIYRKFFMEHQFIKKIFFYLNFFLICSFTSIYLKIVFLIS